MELLFLAILIITMAAALGSGFPVAFSLPGAAILSITLAAVTGYLFTGNVDAYFYSGGPGEWLSAGVTNLRGVYWDVDRDTLIAIPLFIFMGIMLQRSKIAEDLLVTMAQLFGPIPGGLGISVVFVGGLLAATTGIVGATVVAMGLISLPAMLRNNYSRPLATGTIAASGTLGQIIPPSIVLIILADQLASASDQASTIRKAMHKDATGELTMPSVFDVTSTSASEMFLGAFVPGIVLVGLYMVYILVYALLRPKVAPAVSYDGKFNTKFVFRVILILVPPLTLILLVLGSIIAGIATVNQAGAIGAAGALIMAGYRLMEGRHTAYYPALLAILAVIIAGFALSYYPMNIKAVRSSSDAFGIFLGGIATLMLLISLAWSGWRAFKIDDTLRGVMVETAKTTSLVFIILLGAAMLTSAFRAFGGEELVKDFLNGLPGGFWSKFIIVMAVIFVLGFFLDFIEIAVVVVPIVAPILLADPGANITAVWLGVMIGLNIQTSFLTPPFGFALFYLRGVAPAIVRTIEMYKGVIAFIALQIGALFIVGMYPPLVNYLPNRVSLLSETAPPPRNPRLQTCIQDYTLEQFRADRTRIDSAITTVRQLDFSTLPDDLRAATEQSFGDAESAIKILYDAEIAGAIADSARSGYSGVHYRVRRLQSNMTRIDHTIQHLESLSGRAGTSDDARLGYESRIEELSSEREEIASLIPDDWDEIQETYQKLLGDETDLRNQYRRLADSAYDSIAGLRSILASTDSFLELESELMYLGSSISSLPPSKTHDLADDISNLFGDVAGASDIKSSLSKVRRELKKQSPDIEKVLSEYDTTVELYNEQKEWRLLSVSLVEGIETYESEIRSTLGIRSQPRLTRPQALYVAGCLSYHRDISLNF